MTEGDEIVMKHKFTSITMAVYCNIRVARVIVYNDNSNNDDNRERDCRSRSRGREHGVFSALDSTRIASREART